MQMWVPVVAAALVVCVVGAVPAAGKGGCCTPDQWQGEQASQTGYVYHGRPGAVQGSVYVFYDYTNKRTASFANYTTGEGRARSYRMVQLYAGDKGGKLYVVDLQNDKCYKKKLEGSFRKACIPDNARPTGAFSYGAGKAKLDALGYSIRVRKEEETRLDVFVSVTKEGCVPITESVMGRARGVPLMEGVGFVNIKPTIGDPSVFDIPEQCRKMHHDWMKAELFGEQCDECVSELFREHSIMVV